jgi:signal transduction histidine kinase/CheY-like chemotaxis protein
MDKSHKETKNLVISLLNNAYASRINNLKLSRELAKKALSISKKIDDKVLIGKSLNQLALFSMIMGQYKLSMNMSRKAIKYFKELNDEKGIAEAKYNLGGICYKTDNYHLGLVYLIDSLTIYRKFRDYHNQARVLKSVGTIYEFFGDEKNAIKSYESAIRAAKKAGDLNLESNVYNPISGIYLNQNKIEKALETIERALNMKTQTGDIRGLAFSIYGRAKIYAKKKQFQQAEKGFKETIRIHLEMGEMLGLAMAYYKLGALYSDMNSFAKAKATLNKALEISEKYNMVIIKFKSNYILYEIYKKEGKADTALIYLEKYLKEKEMVINTQTLKVIENYALISKMEALEKAAQVQREKAEIIEKKNRAEHMAGVKQDFLSTMSHEIRTPLNAVITIASLLEDKSNENEQQLIDSLKFASNNLLLIINDILDFTKLDSGIVHLESRASDFRLLMENIKNTYKNLAREKGLSLDMKIAKEVSKSYEVDETKLSQILGNLITNAIKFTETGKIDVIIERIGHGNTHDKLRFKIIDTGVGVPEGYLSAIFDSFFQPKLITTRKHGGSGLGLAIVKKLLELHESVIKVDSAVGKGSTFSFDLEVKRSEIPNQPPSQYSTHLKDKKVLLVEDNLINAMVAMKLLSNWGMVTDHAKNGAEAVEKSKLKAFDFILMDIHMPGMDGFEATKQIRKQNNPNMRIPIFALTADITKESHQEYLSYFDRLLWKPIEKDKLYDALMSS